MRFRLVEWLLEEDIDSMRKYYNNIPDMLFKEYVAIDPTYKGGNQPGKYARWILGLADKGEIAWIDDDIQWAKHLLQEFSDNYWILKDRDIMKYKSLEELDKMLNDDNSYSDLSHRQKVRERQKNRRNADLNKDAKRVYEDDLWEVWTPLTYEGSCKLGEGTSWCTATTETSAYYNAYVYGDSQGNEEEEEIIGDYEYYTPSPLYVFIDKSNPKRKYQLHVGNQDFMDENDNPADLRDIMYSDMPMYEWAYDSIEFLNDEVNMQMFELSEPWIVELFKSHLKTNIVNDNRILLYDKKLADSISSEELEVLIQYFNDTFDIDGVKVSGVYLDGGNLFRRKRYIEYVILDNCSVGREAFYGCVNLTSVSISGDVSIGVGAFGNCKSITLVETDMSKEKAKEISLDTQFLMSNSDDITIYCTDGEINL